MKKVRVSALYEPNKNEARTTRAFKHVVPFICLFFILGFLIHDGVNAITVVGVKGAFKTDCKDKSDDCPALAAGGYCTSEGGFEVQKSCPRSCGLCDCRDLATQDQCDTIKKNNFCTSDERHSDYYCRKTCGFCNSA
ncbi:shTK domain protein [Ostertagia ostertagi]